MTDSIGPAVVASWPSSLPPATGDHTREIAERMAAMCAWFAPERAVVGLRAAFERSVSLYPLGEPTVEGTHCPCGNQRRASRRCCRACERYFWSRSTDLARPAVAVPRCAWHARFRLPTDVCPEITSLTVAMAVSVRRMRQGARRS